MADIFLSSRTRRPGPRESASPCPAITASRCGGDKDLDAACTWRTELEEQIDGSAACWCCGPSIPAGLSCARKPAAPPSAGRCSRCASTTAMFPLAFPHPQWIDLRLERGGDDPLLIEALMTPLEKRVRGNRAACSWALTPTPMARGTSRPGCASSTWMPCTLLADRDDTPFQVETPINPEKTARPRRTCIRFKDALADTVLLYHAATPLSAGVIYLCPNDSNLDYLTPRPSPWSGSPKRALEREQRVPAGHPARLHLQPDPRCGWTGGHSIHPRLQPWQGRESTALRLYRAGSGRGRGGLPCPAGALVHVHVHETFEADAMGRHPHRRRDLPLRTGPHPEVEGQQAPEQGASTPTQPR